MENKLEQLLNSLVEAWWKPRWLLNEIEYIHAFDDVNQGWRVEISYGDHWYYKALRQIVSKESWLWQFVCENGMVEDKWEIRYKADENNDINDANYMSEFYYWLLEASLKDESELEDFLLQNIKIKW